MQVVYVIAIFLFCHMDIYAKYDVQKESNKVVDQFLKKIAPLNIRAIGVGGGVSDEVNLISLHLVTPKCLTLDEAKFLYPFLISTILNDFNSNKSLRPYLHNYPFTYENLHIILACRGNIDPNEPTRFISLIYEARDKIFYKTADPVENFITYFEEPIEEALIRIQNCEGK